MKKMNLYKFTHFVKNDAQLKQKKKVTNNQKKSQNKAKNKAKKN